MLILGLSAKVKSSFCSFNLWLAFILWNCLALHIRQSSTSFSCFLSVKLTPFGEKVHWLTKFSSSFRTFLSLSWKIDSFLFFSFDWTLMKTGESLCSFYVCFTSSFDFELMLGRSANCEIVSKYFFFWRFLILSSLCAWQASKRFSVLAVKVEESTLVDDLVDWASLELFFFFRVLETVLLEMLFELVFISIFNMLCKFMIFNNVEWEMKLLEFLAVYYEIFGVFLFCFLSWFSMEIIFYVFLC